MNEYVRSNMPVNLQGVGKKLAQIRNIKLYLRNLLDTGGDRLRAIELMGCTMQTVYHWRQYMRIWENNMIRAMKAGEWDEAKETLAGYEGWFARKVEALKSYVQEQGWTVQESFWAGERKKYDTQEDEKVEACTKCKWFLTMQCRSLHVGARFTCGQFKMK